MKTVQLLVGVIPMVVAALAQGMPQNTSPVAPAVAHLGPAFTGDDIKSLVETIKTDSLPKTEFETTAEYEARRRATQKDGAALVFVFGDEQQFTYDADSEMMMTSVPVNKRHFYLEPTSPEYSVLNIRNVQRSQREYIGSNAYGAEAKVSSSFSEEYGIVINQSLESSLLLAMNTVTAKDAKPFLRLGIACKLLRGTIVNDVSGHEATFSNPSEYYTHYFYLPVVVTELFVFDKRDGTVLLRVRSNSSDDIAMQTELRKKTFPIELEVRGIGLLYVKIDGGKEEPLFENTVVRAKRQLYLKLSSQYDRFDLRLNGITYTPAWSVHNKAFGSFSMFDYADATISSADLNRESQAGASQSPIDPHKIGETFQEWLAINQIDLAGLCRTNKNACKRLNRIQKSGHGECSTTNDAHQVFTWLFVNGKVAEVR